MADSGQSHTQPREASSLREYLAGRWLLERSVVDRRAGCHGALCGWAELAAEGEDFRYREEGLLTLPQGAFQTSRALRFRFPAPQLAQVFFPNGDFFHDLALGALPWKVSHHCGQDVYRGSFRQLGRDCWMASWQVTGPRKRQLIDSRYQRD